MSFLISCGMTDDNPSATESSNIGIFFSKHFCWRFYILSFIYSYYLFVCSIEVKTTKYSEQT